jgi:hypothetical protein
VFGIFTSRAMKERGQYQIQCLKSRSSTGVGSKIDLEYNIETMRITDEGESNDQGHFRPPTATSVLDQIKTSSTVTNNPPKITAQYESTKLQQLMGEFKRTQI